MNTPYVSRAGLKLAHALDVFEVDPTDLTCADLGSNVGGFVDCLLRRGAARVYAVDTGYGVLDWRLRNDPRVVVMERTNAIHVTLPELPRLITIDVAWTRQRIILPAARKMVGLDGWVVTLVKPHYEAPPQHLRNGVLSDEHLPAVQASVAADMKLAGFTVLGVTPSPIKGGQGNTEYLACLRPKP
jgi:23S rRNA (cytidine1920-2'-O)/16S rRNA (cytidine1409-2'-O)-methyltransferase